MKTIVTHSSNFHRDDIFAVATLMYMLEEQGYKLGAKDKNKAIKVVRTLEPEKVLNADYVVDIGGKYEPKKNWLDHHQVGGAGKRENGVPYASFGLVWKHFGKKLAGSDLAFDWVDRHLVQGIDGPDNGMVMHTPVIDDVSPVLIEDYMRSVVDVVRGEVEIEEKNNKDNKKNAGKNNKPNTILLKKLDKEFMRMVEIAKDMVRVFIFKAKQKEKITKIAKKAYEKAEDKRVIIWNAFIPSRFEEFKAPEFVEPLVHVYPDLRNGWSAKVVRLNDHGYESRISFPESWRGKRDEELAKETGIADAKFCHNSGFLAVADSKEGILEMVRLAFKILKVK